MNILTYLALFSGKLIRSLTQKLKIGGGTAAPGLVALTIDKNFVANLVKKNHLESIVITGTNGKTTTARMLSAILAKAAIDNIHNRAGSNLLRGVASALIEKANLAAKIDRKCAIWEVDEAVMPEITRLTTPKVLLINNLFRDQLDRFGEVEKLREIWAKTAKKLNKNNVLILNSNDPQIAYLATQTQAEVFYFGILDKNFGFSELPKAADARFCPNCQTPLVYSRVFVHHMGQYSCPKCQLRTPEPEIFASKIDNLKSESVIFQLVTPQGKTKIKLSVGGLYNIYNGLAAAAAAYSLEINLKTIKAGLENFKAAFGRVEKFKIDNKLVSVYLVKNPAGFSEVVKTLFLGSGKKNVLLALNDNLADGTDVSWIWDVDFAPMLGKTDKVFVTGKRAQDLALRLKYSGIRNLAKVENNMEKVLKTALKKSSQKLYLLPTYTAMLELRKILNQAGYGTKFWED